MKPQCIAWLQPIFQMVWSTSALINGLRLLLSFLILLVPTTAMGLTFPVLLGEQALRRHDFGRVVGLLYGANTLGAVAGVLIGEGLLIEAVGLWGTGLAAGSLSFAAAAVAWILDRSNPIEYRAMSYSWTLRLSVTSTPKMFFLTTSILHTIP